MEQYTKNFVYTNFLWYNFSIQINPYRPMKILKPGQTFRNYKALCEYLNEPILAGYSKIRQLEKWQEHFSFLKEGHSFVITAFYTTPTKTKTSLRWKDVIDPQIVLHLVNAMRGFGVNQASSDLKELILYNSEAFVQLGLCNNSHKKLRDGELECELDADTQQECYDKSYTRLRRIYYSALDRLHEARFIYYIKRYLRPNPPMILSDEEEARVELLKGRLLSAMDFPDERAVCRSKQRYEFYRTLRLLIQTDPKLGYETLYSVNRIFFTEESIQQASDILHTQTLRHELAAKANERSMQMHLELFKEKPLSGLANLVILRQGKPTTPTL